MSPPIPDGTDTRTFQQRGAHAKTLSRNGTKQVQTDLKT